MRKVIEIIAGLTAVIGGAVGIMYCLNRNKKVKIVRRHVTRHGEETEDEDEIIVIPISKFVDLYDDDEDDDEEDDEEDEDIEKFFVHIDTAENASKRNDETDDGCGVD